MAQFKRSFEEILARANVNRPRKRPSDEEHRIQCACVQWMYYQHPELFPVLFAIPNGGRRDKTTGAKLKAEGVKSGVADLELAKPSRQYHALFIEMKTPKGYQSYSQKCFQKEVE